MKDYANNGVQNYGNEQCVPAPQPVEAQPVGNIPTSVLNSQPGQQSEHHYEQISPGNQQQFAPQQGYAPPPGNASHAQPPPGYAPQTQPPPGYAPHTQPAPGYAPQTQPPPGYAPQTQPPPGYAQHGYFSQSGLSNNKVAPATQPVFATPSSGVAPGQAPAYENGTGQQVVTQVTQSHSVVS